MNINGKKEKCHVKNTGRCRELLIPGVEVILSISDNPKRSTLYDVIAVNKNGMLVNIDSQVPNDVVFESLNNIPIFSFVEEKYREYVCDDSRFDIVAYGNGRKALIEVKGVTLENDGIAKFPDAPTERGRKHLNGLIRQMENGWETYVVLLIQMSSIKEFRPNYETDPEFADTLKKAMEAGVTVLAYSSIIEPNSISLGEVIPISFER